MSEINPRDFGAMEAKVDKLEKSVENLEAKVDQLIALANQGRGAYWAGMFLAGGIGAGVIALIKFVFSR